uniref:LIM zinc-binding domain-containing protein n=1 Tax=Arion vulgaris TaxID=1028688 RepID=A0A0B7B9L7_9EUPU
MSKKCAKCQKIVYPTEELKCLDKVWHKSCFKCEVCGMTLNMKNYKGYDKIPYCNAHCPTAKHTQVADTPETRRIAENTKIQSNVQYHADFEKQKGHKTSVVDDPELERTKQNTQIQSNVNYWGLKEQREQMEGRRPNDGLDDVTSRSRYPGKITDYNPPEDIDSRHSNRSSAGNAEESRNSAYKGAHRPGFGGHTPFSYGGSPPGAPSNRTGLATNQSSFDEQSQQGYGQPRSSYGESQQAPYSYAQAPQAQQQPSRPAQQQQQQQPSRPAQQQPSRPAQPQAKQVVYQALYNYTAADSDEVSFKEFDHIINVQEIDSGWMKGTVQRTGESGMLPSNYVERVN